MTDINFDAVNLDSEIDWPQRGRKKRPLPENLVNALHTSFSQGSTPHLQMKNDQVQTFKNLLSRAGAELNYRIEKVIKENHPSPGITTVYFRTKHRRNEDD